MDRSDRRYHIIYNLPTYLEAHLAVHRAGRSSVNFRPVILKSGLVSFPLEKPIG